MPSQDTLSSTVIQQLGRIVGRSHLLTEPEERACYSYDASRHQFCPDVVVLPENAEQISAILRLANTHRFAVIPRGAGSGMTGCALPVQGGVVLACSRMNRILEIDADNMIAVAEPGVILGEFQDAVAQHGLLYPPDPASLKFCTLGGNAAECAGGPQAVKYGVTRDYILGLEVVLPSGVIIHCGVRTEKGVVGYDLTRLFIGSEGTLGVFTRLILHLVPLPEARATFLLLFDSMSSATGMVTTILQTGILPASLEFMDQTATKLVARDVELTGMAQAAALLLVELDGTSAEVQQQRQRIIQLLDDHQISYHHAKNDAERTTLWQARRQISPLAFTLRPHKISEDVVVPRAKIPELVDWVRQTAKKLHLVMFTFGHAGDGNIHVNIMVDKNNPLEYKRAQQAREALFTRVLSLDGTLSGEHGIGITKAPYLAREIDPPTLQLMRDLKHFFDPNNILNPGKIFPAPP